MVLMMNHTTSNPTTLMHVIVETRFVARSDVCILNIQQTKKYLNVQNSKNDKRNRFCVEIKTFILLNMISFSFEIVFFGGKRNILGKAANQEKKNL